MILWGKISQFSVFMVLQLLSSYQKSGQLQIEDNEERAVIYLNNGYVDAVSVPRSDHLLGTRLVRLGKMSHTELRKIILAEKLRSRNEYMGITLMRSGRVDDKAMTAIIAEQAYENTLELSNWVEGTFKFVIPRNPVVFPVSPHINVQHLLLETSRRLDEGRRPSKAKPELPGEDLCSYCNAHCNKAQKEKYLKDGICLWRNMPVVVRETMFTSENETITEDEEEGIGYLPFL